MCGRWRAACAAVAGGELSVGMLEAMPFGDAVADVVICNSVLHFARDEQHFLAMVEELWRVLRPGGMLFCRLGVADWDGVRAGAGGMCTGLGTGQSGSWWMRRCC